MSKDFLFVFCVNICLKYMFNISLERHTSIINNKILLIDNNKKNIIMNYFY